MVHLLPARCISNTTTASESAFPQEGMRNDVKTPGWLIFLVIFFILYLLVAVVVTILGIHKKLCCSFKWNFDLESFRGPIRRAKTLIQRYLGHLGNIRFWGRATLQEDQLIQLRDYDAELAVVTSEHLFGRITANFNADEGWVQQPLRSNL